MWCVVWAGWSTSPPTLKEVTGRKGSLHFPEVDAPEVGALVYAGQAASTRCIALPCVSRCGSWCDSRSFAYRYWYRTSRLRIDRGAPAHMAICDEVLIGCVRMRASYRRLGTAQFQGAPTISWKVVLESACILRFVPKQRPSSRRPPRIVRMRTPCLSL